MMAKAETKKNAKRVFTCKICKAEFTSGLLLGRHYDDEPDHRPKARPAKKKIKRNTGKGKPARTEDETILSQTTGKVDGEIVFSDKKALARLKRRLDTLQKRLADLGPVMRGSVVVIGTRNKQPYFSLNKNKNTKLIYLGKKREARAREYSDNYSKLREIVEEMTELNMILLKRDYQR